MEETSERRTVVICKWSNAHENKISWSALHDSLFRLAPTGLILMPELFLAKRGKNPRADKSAYKLGVKGGFGVIRQIQVHIPWLNFLFFPTLIMLIGILRACRCRKMCSKQLRLHTDSSSTYITHACMHVRFYCWHMHPLSGLPLNDCSWKCWHLKHSDRAVTSDLWLEAQRLTSKPDSSKQR